MADLDQGGVLCRLEENSGIPWMAAIARKTCFSSDDTASSWPFFWGICSGLFWAIFQIFPSLASMTAETVNASS
jgi:hypothetical protein